MSERKYPTTIAPMLAPLGEGAHEFSLIRSVPVDDSIMDALQKVERGGRLYFRRLRPGGKSKAYAYLEYWSPEDIQNAKNAMVAKEKNGDVI